MLDKAQSVCLAVFLTAQFSLNSLFSPFLLIGWVSLALATVWTYVNHVDRPSWVLGALVFLQFSQLSAIPGSIIWGTNNWVLTAGVFLWVLPMPLVYLAASRHIEKWVCIFALLHALLIILQGIIGVERCCSSTGFSHNPNLAAGFLIISLPFAIKGPWRWLLIPILAAVIFTGSRWGFIVASVMILAMGYKNVISFKWVLVGLGSFLFAIGLMSLFSPTTVPVLGSVMALDDTGEGSRLLSQIKVRLGTTGWPNLLPYGVAETDGLHNVPMRMAAESGILSAMVWVFLSGWALCQMRFSPAWWLMASILLLSLLDHYTWRPHLMGFWFVALGILAVRPTPKINTG
jgi:hypothetical protein